MTSDFASSSWPSSTRNNGKKGSARLQMFGVEFPFHQNIILSYLACALPPIHLIRIKEALVHNLRSGAGWRPYRRFQASLRDTGMPRAVTRLSTLQPTLASTFCPDRVRARSVRPMMVL